jgi:vitamin B12 transporter
VYDPNNFVYTAKGDTTYSSLFRVPATSINFSSSYRLNKSISLTLNQRLAGKRFEPVFGGSPVLLKAYQTTDLFAQLKIGKKLRLYGSLKNIFNQDYQEVMGYAARGRNYTIGLQW